MTNDQATRLLTLVRSMRELQRGYFRCRPDRGDSPREKERLLNDSKAAESAVDRLVKELSDDRPSLFGEDA